MEIGTDLYLYHEKQDAGLCAVHALNALLQGAYFTEIDLAEIAKEFDEEERRVMMEMGTETKEFLQFLAEDSGNLADDGNYSIQVISKALTVFHLHASPLTSPEMKTARQDPLTESAFICNLANHWLTVRKFCTNRTPEGEWYNLNSLEAKPQYLSPFYLSAFLDTLMGKGYTVFVVRGDFPKIITDATVIKTDKNWKKTERPRSSSKSAPTSDVDKELQAALEASELEAAIQMSLANTATSTPTTSNAPSANATQQKRKSDTVDLTEDEEDEELLEAIRMSQEVSSQEQNVEVEPEPDKGPETAEMVLKLPDGSRLQRRFLKSSKIQELYSFVKQKYSQPFQIVVTFPRKVLQDKSQTVDQAGLFPGASLIVEKV